MLFLIPLHADLVASDDSIQSVLLAEPLRDIGPELHSDTPLAGAPAWCRLGIGPQHLHHQAGLARLPLRMSVYFSDVVEADVVVGEQPAVEN